MEDIKDNIWGVKKRSNMAGLNEENWRLPFYKPKKPRDFRKTIHVWPRHICLLFWLISKYAWTVIIHTQIKLVKRRHGAIIRATSHLQVLVGTNGKRAVNSESYGTL